jgi:hypothetical protein
MARWNVKIIGTLKFERDMCIYAMSDHDAKIVAEELLKNGAHENEEIIIHEIYAEPLKEPEYEIGIRKK